MDPSADRSPEPDLGGDTSSRATVGVEAAQLLAWYRRQAEKDSSLQSRGAAALAKRLDVMRWMQDESLLDPLEQSLYVTPAYTVQSSDWNPIDLRQGFRHHRVSARGQLVVPLASREALGVGAGGYVELSLWETCVLIRRSFKPLVSAASRSSSTAPGSVVEEIRALLTVSSASRISTAAYGSVRYKVSEVGQVSLPAVTRRAWGLERGGIVEVAGIGNTVVVMPTGGSDDLVRSWLRFQPPPQLDFLGPKALGSSAERGQPAGLLISEPTIRMLLRGTEPAELGSAQLRVASVEYEETIRTLALTPGPTPVVNHDAGLPTGAWKKLLLDIERTRELRARPLEVVATPPGVLVDASELSRIREIDERTAITLLLCREVGGRVALPTPTVEQAERNGVLDTLGLDYVDRKGLSP